jgi:hypothetical protein
LEIVRFDFVHLEAVREWTPESLVRLIVREANDDAARRRGAVLLLLALAPEGDMPNEENAAALNLGLKHKRAVAHQNAVLVRQA